MIQLLAGDCRDVLATLPAESVQCVVTSPPYYGLRDYGTSLWDGGDAACSHAIVVNADRTARTERNAIRDDSAGVYATPSAWPGGGRQSVIGPARECRCGARRIDRQIGLEATPAEYLATMVAVCREVRRVLRTDGVAFINMGDGYRDKQLLLMPARLALALQADGWWVRSDIIWHKPNPMPESCTDRPTSAHEHVFLLTRSARYFYDAEAVRETTGNEMSSDEYAAAVAGYPGRSNDMQDLGGGRGRKGFLSATPPSGRNLRNVWTLPTQSFSGSHFATFPTALAERCIRAGTRLGDTVLDPFAGAGTTLLVADRLQRDAIGIELNPDYTTMAMQRCRDDAPLFTAFPPAEPPEDARMADLFADAAG